MIDITTICYPILLIENNHLNLYNTQFDTDSLLKFVEKFNNNFINSMVTNVCISQEITNEQKNILTSKFPNLQNYIIKK